MKRRLPSEELALVNETSAACFALSSVVKSWSVPLFDPLMNNQPELRNRIFPVLISGIMDACQEYEDRYSRLYKLSDRLGYKSAKHYLNIFHKYTDLAMDLLSQLSMEEIIFLSDLRNQYVHCKWNNVGDKPRHVRCIQDGELKYKKISFEDYYKISSEIWGRSGTVDEIVMPMRHRISHYRTFFWTITLAVSIPLFSRCMANDLAMGREWRSASAVIEIPPPSHRPDHGNDAFCTLLEAGARLFDSRVMLDPVTAA